MTFFIPQAPDTKNPQAVADWMNLVKGRLEQSSPISFGVPIRAPALGQIPYYFGTQGWRGAYANSFLVAGSNVTITGTSTVTIALSSNITNSFPARTAIAGTAYNIQTADYLVAYTTLGSAVTATLPSATGISRQAFIVKDESGNAGTNNLTVATSTSVQKIDGAATKVINTNYGDLRVYTDGTSYFTW